jgi:hypothetical protein
MKKQIYTKNSGGETLLKNKEEVLSKPNCSVLGSTANSVTSTVAYSRSIERDLIFLYRKAAGQCSWFSNCFQAGRQRRRSLSPSRAKNILFSKFSTLVLGSTQAPN